MTATNTLALILLLIITTATTLTAAAELPEFYPSDINHMGSLDRIDARDNAIVIGDIKFLLVNDLRVHTPDRSFATLQSLRPGTRVGVNFFSDGKGAPLVTDIWVLPSR